MGWWVSDHSKPFKIMHKSACSWKSTRPSHHVHMLQSQYLLCWQKYSWQRKCTWPLTWLGVRKSWRLLWKGPARLNQTMYFSASRRPWGWQLWQIPLLRRVMIVCCAADDNTQHPHTPATIANVVSWSCCHPLSHPFILAIIKWIQTDTPISSSKTDGGISHLRGSLAVLQNYEELETVSFKSFIYFLSNL